MKEQITVVQQSGVIPFAKQGGCWQILLITSRRTGEWVVPKGGLEPEMTAWESAAQEAYEEAGVFGDVEEIPIGEYRYRKFGGLRVVTLFPMRVTEVATEWPEMHQRKRIWVDVGDVEDWVESLSLRRALRGFYHDVLCVLEGNAD